MRPWMFICIAFAAVFLFGGNKPHVWKSGIIVEIGSDRKSESTTTSGTKPNGMPDGTQTVSRRSWDQHSYSISGDGRTYVFNEDIPLILGGSLPIAKAMKLEIGASIQYAIEKNSIYVVVGGRERKFKIARVTLNRIP